jgi:hypothetical protein
LVKQGDQETIGDASNRLALSLPSDCSPLSVSCCLVTLNEEGRGAQSVERTLAIVLDADVQLVVTYGH